MPASYTRPSEGCYTFNFSHSIYSISELTERLLFSADFFTASKAFLGSLRSSFFSSFLLFLVIPDFIVSV